MSLQIVIFIILAVSAVASALGMLFSRNSVYAVLYLILNFVTVAMLYLLLSAPFIAIAQVTVYAGAIMVLFLFVIMLLGAESSGHTIPRWWNQPLALGLALLLLIEGVMLAFSQRGNFPSPAAVASVFGSPEAIGLLLFNHYLLPFEITSILLLAAMVGVITLIKLERKPGPEKK